MSRNDFYDACEELDWSYATKIMPDKIDDPLFVARIRHGDIKALVLDEPMKFGDIHKAWQDYHYKAEKKPVKSDFIKSKK